MIPIYVINPIVGVYIPIIRIPIKGGMTIPNTTRLLTMAHIILRVNFPLHLTFLGSHLFFSISFVLFLRMVNPWRKPCQKDGHDVGPGFVVGFRCCHLFVHLEGFGPKMMEKIL